MQIEYLATNLFHHLTSLLQGEVNRVKLIADSFHLFCL